MKDVLEWLSYGLAGVGLLAGLAKAVQVWMSLDLLTWKEVDTLSRRILRQIDKSGFHPDVIVCIGRGGAILGAILSGNLKNPDGIEKKSNVTLLGVDRIYSWENGRRHEVANEMVDLAPLRGKRVLLVSGDILSGGTMSFFLDAVRQVGGADTRTACLVKGVGSTLIPDFFGKEITASFRTPWMYRGLGYARDSRKPT